METNVSTLLRDFPSIRRAALGGETVIVHTREGDLRITAAQASPRSLLGFLAGALVSGADDLDQPTTAPGEWKASL